VIQTKDFSEKNTSKLPDFEDFFFSENSKNIARFLK
jgi:hypothetical protein